MDQQLKNFLWNPVVVLAFVLLAKGIPLAAGQNADSETEHLEEQLGVMRSQVFQGRDLVQAKEESSSSFNAENRSESMPKLDNEKEPLPVSDKAEAPTAEQKVISSASVDKSTMKPTSVSEAKGINPEMIGQEDNLKKQTIEGITRDQLIDQYFKEAKSIKLPEPEPRQEVSQELQKTQTNEEVVRSMINPSVKNQRIDLDFEEVKLGDMFMTLGNAAQLNIMLDPELKSRTTDFHLKQVPVEEALILTANAFNLGFKRVGDSLYVTDLEKLRKENLVSKVFKLHNIDVAEAKALITDVIKSVNISEEINSLIAKGQPEEIQQIEQILKTIDRPQPQVVLEARIIEINRDALKDLGVDWSDQITLSYQEAGRPVDFNDPEETKDPPLEIQGLARNALQFDTVIHMLENQNKAKILSTPRVTTLNNKEAEIFVGDRFPYTVTTISGGVATTDVRFEEPGIRLKITPSIIEDNFVVIKVEPEVSFIFAFRGPNDQYPWTKKRQATAYVRVKNNQPFILGGILNQEDKKNLYKVPMLGNIPLLGNLFSYKKDTVVDTELIITIVPKIVHGEL